MPNRRNILYIMTDQQRFATLGSVGESICKTPNLDRLAGRGVRFDRAYSVCALCTPARTSMLSGLYPHNHMLLKNTEWSGPTVLDFKEGTLYPALHRLEKEGLRRGKWERLPGGQERRYYHITGKGQHALNAKLAEWKGFAAAMNLVLQPSIA